MASSTRGAGPPPACRFVSTAARTGRPSRGSSFGLVAVGIALALIVVAGCAPANPSTTTTSARPRTPAQLQILAPTPNQVVNGSTLDLKLAITGATIVAPSQVTGISPTQGHVHVSVDGKLVSMTYGPSQQLTGLTPGTHTVQAEFVASDHRPFANRVVAAVVFQVQ